MEGHKCWGSTWPSLPSSHRFLRSSLSTDGSDVKGKVERVAGSVEEYGSVFYALVLHVVKLCCFSAGNFQVLWVLPHFLGVWFVVCFAVFLEVLSYFRVSNLRWVLGKFKVFWKIRRQDFCTPTYYDRVICKSAQIASLIFEHFK